MQAWDIPVPTNFVETDAGKLDAFLRARGVAIDGVQMAAVDGIPVRIVVIAETDPAAEVAAYAPAPNPGPPPDAEAEPEAYLAARASAILDADPSERSDADRDVLALLAVLLPDTTQKGGPDA